MASDAAPTVSRTEDEPTSPTPPPSKAPRSAFAIMETLAKWLEQIRKVTVSLAVVFGVSVVAILVVREVSKEGIVVEPVVVQLPDLKAAPTPDLAAQQRANPGGAGGGAGRAGRGAPNQ